MKKLSLLIFLLFFSNFTFGQAKTFMGSVGISAGSGFMNGHKEYQPIEIIFAPGYNITDNFYAKITGNINIGLFEQNDNRWWESDFSLGGGVGYKFYKSGNLSWAAEIMAGNSVVTNELRYNYYDGRIQLDVGRESKLFMGIGTKYYNSHTRFYDNFLTLYVAVGFKFN